MLEVKEPNGEFPFYDPKTMAVKVFVYNAESKSFASHQVNIDKQANVSDLKVGLILTCV